MTRKKKIALPGNWIWPVVLIPSLLLNIFFVLRKPPETATGVKVIGVIDGDTLVLEGKSRIRLRHADAPELEYCGGKQAKDALEKLILNKNVRIDEQIADKYGRGMALIYVGNKLANEEILKSGWARYHHDISSVEDRLKAASSKAKSEKSGIYGLCHYKDNQDKPECNIKGNIDKNSTARKYYLPNCAQYKFTIVEKDIGEDWFCSEQDARKAGFTKAETCK